MECGDGAYTTVFQLRRDGSSSIPEDRIQASAFVDHDRFVFERIPLVYQSEFVGAITKGTPLPRGYASNTVADIAQPPIEYLGQSIRWFR